jgi:LacI family transcriptional regulator
MPITVEEIAKLAGVSRATVSRVVNNHPHIRPEVRERVQRVIDEHNYHPNRAAQSLASRRTNAIGLIVPNSFPLMFHDVFFPRLIQGIAEVSNTCDYYVTLILTTQPECQAAQFRRVLSNATVDGLVVANLAVHDPLLPMLEAGGLPFVLVGRNPERPHLSFVDVDNAGGARAMTEFLLSLGHRRIALIAGPLARSAGQDRLDGYQAALQAAGMAVNPALIAEGEFTEESGYRAMHHLMPASPTAVFACNDLMALGAVRALADAGLRVPDHVSVAGFDNLMAAAASSPPLTTIEQPVVELGRSAAELLLQRIQAGDGPPPPSRMLPTRLVPRLSTRVL